MIYDGAFESRLAQLVERVTSTPASMLRHDEVSRSSRLMGMMSSTICVFFLDFSFNALEVLALW